MNHTPLFQQTEKNYILQATGMEARATSIFMFLKRRQRRMGPCSKHGAAINTPFNEDTPFITQNDSVLYFSSEGHSSMGGYDIFKSQKNRKCMENTNQRWVSYNTTDDDKFSSL